MKTNTLMELRQFEEWKRNDGHEFRVEKLFFIQAISTSIVPRPHSSFLQWFYDCVSTDTAFALQPIYPIVLKSWWKRQFSTPQNFPFHFFSRLWLIFATTHSSFTFFRPLVARESPTPDYFSRSFSATTWKIVINRVWRWMTQKATRFSFFPDELWFFLNISKCCHLSRSTHIKNNHRI